MDKIDFLLAGVGGQGVLTASDIVAEVGMTRGYDAKKSEVHGFSQRGGIVESHVRWGSRIAAPLAEKGTIDILVAFELLEGARWSDYLRPGGTAIVSRQRILPMTVTAGEAVYPAEGDIEALLRAVAEHIIFVDALDIATRLGNPQLTNTVLLGVLSTVLDIEPQVWLSVIERRVPAKWLEANRRAFAAGREVVR
jgi:indolepyruvate ferredoxin oxidoreductase beta subunit